MDNNGQAKPLEDYTIPELQSIGFIKQEQISQLQQELNVIRQELYNRAQMQQKEQFLAKMNKEKDESTKK